MAAVCPHCGFTQQESVAAKSTFCRKCQQHYNLERMLAGEKSIVKEPGLFSKLTRMVLGDRQRDVTCFTCGHQQKLSKEAQSTMCPGCGAYMDLRDFKISAPFGRSVQTAGDVFVTSSGDVTSTKMMCGELYLEGSLRGHAIVTGTATVKVKGRLIGTIDSPHILVEKKSQLEFARPVHTKLFEVSGTVRADVHADKVVINKGGWLEGSVHARAITVEKGGIFSGDLEIGQDSVEPVATESVVEAKQPESGVRKKPETATKVEATTSPELEPEPPIAQSSEEGSEPSTAPEPVQETPPQPQKPTTVLKSVEAPKPVQLPRPTVVLKPVEPPKPPDSAKPRDPAKSLEPKTTDNLKPDKNGGLPKKNPTTTTRLTNAELPFGDDAK
jgi:cytoskeletal protein CcmA (bactofilin family)/predicted RNA-binding Zn-ribbon protein involved in translation (DUF1610 family)